jgi:flagellar hook protein FlgE
MGLFSAMTTAISGLNAQSYALENISGNIANSQTLGFKRNDTNFTDLVPDFGGPRQVSGSVAADKKQTISLAGDFQASSFGTDIALQGSGYFVVRKKQLTQNGTLAFGTDLYTRRGDFRQDKNNYLVNGAGYYLSGYKLDAKGGRNGTLGPIQIPTGLIEASATTSVVYQGNLPVNPTSGTKTAVPAGPVALADAAAETAFLSQTISGGSLNLYNAQGNSQTLQLRWGKTGANQWDAYYLSNSAAVLPATKWTSLGNFASFNASGALTTTTPVTIAPTINGVPFTGISFDLTGTTQFGDTGGAFTATQLTQNGYTAGNAIGLTINDSGRIFQSYTNGKSIPIADIEVANFNGDDALNRIDGGTFEETDGSGVALLGLGSANVRSSGVEASNVDIAQEFTKLITTQQAYSANTKVITTAQDLLAATINIIR